MRSFAFASLLLACFLALPQAALAQSFPARTVRIATPYSTGIAPDVAVRLVADGLGKLWGQSVTVEPRPGGNGLIAINQFKRAAADGHELILLGNAHLTINPSLLKSVPYAPEADFVPIALLYRTSYFLGVATGSPYANLTSLVAGARAEPGKLTYTSAYVGSPLHLAGAMLAHLTETSMTAIHFKDTGQMYSSVANGDVTFAVGTAGSLGPLVRGGKLRLIATVSPKRQPTFPDVPTAREAGGPAGYDVDTWVGLFAPPGTPAEVVKRIHEGVVSVIREPGVQSKLIAFGVEPFTSSPPEIAELVRLDLKRNGELVKRIGIQPE